MYLHPDLCKELLLLDVLLGADIDLSILGSDRLCPVEDGVSDFKNFLHRLRDGLLQERARLEERLLQDVFRLLPEMASSSR